MAASSWPGSFVGDSKKNKSPLRSITKQHQKHSITVGRGCVWCKQSWLRCGAIMALCVELWGGQVWHCEVFSVRGKESRFSAWTTFLLLGHILSRGVRLWWLFFRTLYIFTFRCFPPNCFWLEFSSSFPSGTSTFDDVPLEINAPKFYSSHFPLDIQWLFSTIAVTNNAAGTSVHTHPMPKRTSNSPPQFSFLHLGIRSSELSKISLNFENPAASPWRCSSLPRI